MMRRDQRRVAGRVAGWDRTRWLVARQPDFPSRSLARASTSLSPFFRPPFWCPLARSLVRSAFSLFLDLSFATPLRPASRGFSSTLPRTLLARPFFPLTSFPESPRTHRRYGAPVPPPLFSHSLTLHEPKDAAEDPSLSPFLPDRECCTYAARGMSWTFNNHSLHLISL